MPFLLYLACTTAPEPLSDTDPMPDSDADTDTDTDTDTTELAYDDGRIDSNSSPWGSDETGAVGVHFTASQDVRLFAVRYFVGIEGVPTTPFAVEIRDWDAEAGLPGDTLLHQTTGAASEGNEWVNVDLSASTPAVGTDFVVAMVFTTPPGENGSDSLFLGTDETDPDDRTFVRYEDWASIVDTWGLDGDGMIRATVAP